MFNMVSLNAPNATLTSKLFGAVTSAAGARELQLGIRATFNLDYPNSEMPEAVRTFRRPHGFRRLRAVLNCH